MAELTVPSEDDLKRLSPVERIKRLKQLEEARRKELEDAKLQIEKELSEKEREVQEQIAAAEALIAKTEEDTDREEVEAALREAQRRREETAREEQESLEARVEGAPRQGAEERTGQYATNLYTALERATERLDELGRKDLWTEYDIRQYQETRAQLDRAQTYSLSDQLRADLGNAFDHLYKMKTGK